MLQWLEGFKREIERAMAETVGWENKEQLFSDYIVIIQTIKMLKRWGK